MNRHVSNQRLLKVARILDSVPEEKFDLRHWKRSPFPWEPECGTVACAVGWAASDPGFKRAGLSVSMDRYGAGEIWFRKHLEGLQENLLGKNAFLNWEAVTEFFGISRDEAFGLFSHASYVEDEDEDTLVGPKRVATKIRKFVNERQK
jgi:hypothetical protein